VYGLHSITDKNTIGYIIYTTTIRRSGKHGFVMGIGSGKRRSGRPKKDLAMNISSRFADVVIAEWLLIGVAGKVSQS